MPLAATFPVASLLLHFYQVFAYKLWQFCKLIRYVGV